jgi:hypothetical protein
MRILTLLPSAPILVIADGGVGAHLDVKIFLDLHCGG